MLKLQGQATFTQHAERQDNPQMRFAMRRAQSDLLQLTCSTPCSKASSSFCSCLAVCCCLCNAEAAAVASLCWVLRLPPVSMPMRSVPRLSSWQGLFSSRASLSGSRTKRSSPCPRASRPAHSSPNPCRASCLGRLAAAWTASRLRCRSPGN